MCGDCSNGEKTKIPPDAVKLVRFLTENSWDRISKLKFEKKCLEGLEELSSRYLRWLVAFSQNI